MFCFDSRVFSAAWGTQGIYLTDCQAVFIKGQEWADIRQLTAGPAASAGAFSAILYWPESSEKTQEFGRPRISGYEFFPRF